MTKDVRFHGGDELITLVSAKRPVRPRKRLDRGSAIDKGERIGAFICRCGGAVDRVVDVDAVAAHTSSLGSVAFVEVMDFPCSTNGREDIRKAIKDNNLGRFVVAGCSPRTHERLFRRVAADAGLNQFMFEIANIREQSAFVHSGPEATRKAKMLVDAAIAKCRLLFPAPYKQLPISARKVLVVGDGLSAMTAVSCISEQGGKVVFVTPSPSLEECASAGVYFDAPAESVMRVVRQLKSNRSVRILTGSDVVEFQGHPGDFRALVETLDGEEDVRCGATILAFEPTFAPRSGIEDERVVTNQEFRDSLRRPPYPKRIVIILPASSTPGMICARSDHIGAIADALRMRELSSSAEITVVSRDIRADGMHELDYRKAQEHGIRFVRYDEEPIIEREGDLRVLVNDPCSDSRLILAADVVVLSGLVSLPNNQKRAKIFGIPIEKNGLFRRTQVRLEPTSTLREGVFVCGGAAGPRLVSEMMIEASAAATMALSVVKKRYIEIGGAVAEIDPEKCCVCLTCIRSCPYTAPFVNDESKAEIDIQTCQGCGICVGICPSKAIEMYSYTDDQIDAQSSAMIKGGQDEG